jgi:hypothetical protein
MKDIYKSSLTNSKCYAWLDDLSNKIGSRLSGSGAEKAVLYTTEMEKLVLTAYFKVMVPKWVRGEKETAYIQDNKNSFGSYLCFEDQ